jgi:hypothetical protein
VTTVPATPTGILASSGPDQITVSWNASSGATAYDLYVGTIPGAESASAATAGLATTTDSLTGLTPGQTYYFFVAARDAGGASSNSAEASATVPPDASSGLTANAGNGSIALSWGAAPGATGYRILEGTASGAESVTVQSDVVGTSTTLSGLTNGKTYYFRVIATNAGGASPASNEASATPSAPAKGGGAMDWSMLLLLMTAVAERWRSRVLAAAEKQRP